MQTSNLLLERTLTVEPNKHTYALNLLHGFEINNEYERAFACACAHLRANADVSLCGVTCGDVCALVGEHETLGALVASQDTEKCIDIVWHGDERSGAEFETYAETRVCGESTSTPPPNVIPADQR